MAEAPDIPGATDITSWFGYWPDFHDAEVVSINLDRSKESRVVVHAWETIGETDAKGYYVRRKHATITFVFEGFPVDSEGITKTRIDFFNQQNVLSWLAVEKTPQGYRLDLRGIYGIDGSILASQMRAELAPGIPPDRQSES